MESIPGLAQWVKDPALQSAVAQVQSLAWELPQAAGLAKKKKKKSPFTMKAPNEEVKMSMVTDYVGTFCLCF